MFSGAPVTSSGFGWITASFSGGCETRAEKSGVRGSVEGIWLEIVMVRRKVERRLGIVGIVEGGRRRVVRSRRPCMNMFSLC